MYQYVSKKRLKKMLERATAFGIYLLSIVIFILGCSYISVPLYQLYCQASGFGGTVQKGSWKGDASSPLVSEAHVSRSQMYSQNQNYHNDKQLTIHFNADTSDNLPWTFKPTMNKINVYPGDTALTFYVARNRSDTAVTGISTYHVTPQKVGIYFNKIQCFCFEEQRLKANESIEMPILFFIDPDFTKDPKMQDVDTITLSYTFFCADS